MFCVVSFWMLGCENKNWVCVSYWTLISGHKLFIEVFVNCLVDDFEWDILGGIFRMGKNWLSSFFLPLFGYSRFFLRLIGLGSSWFFLAILFSSWIFLAHLESLLIFILNSRPFLTPYAPCFPSSNCLFLTFLVSSWYLLACLDSYCILLALFVSSWLFLARCVHLLAPYWLI